VRRSTLVRLTLLPMLASAAVASADPPGETAPISEPQLGPSGIAGGDEILMPPGVTPPLDCREDPEWEARPECDVAGVTIRGGIIRGGFGHYFWAAGG